ncbi:holo-ACP synthase [Clostridium tarantellae]|uniref:Holo-[acyl-carrier-protein] synthase n=1 Tax=Clostridium tarantellae TaxID=39493 RepID=A0A6I1MHX5_9CLOT|nr:holo-ACP synthase [Clostridium tarantellae]MPQ43136.1 holo-ACP synthase [Clostridium tarantellae]
MILGTGIDLIEIQRIKNAIENNSRFMEKIFTYKEIEYFKKRSMNSEVIAGNFAAKEAVSKALGVGIRGFSFKDIEVLRDNFGKPIVTLHNGAKFRANNLSKKTNEYIIHLTISHDKNNAIAYVIFEE